MIQATINEDFEAFEDFQAGQPRGRGSIIAIHEERASARRPARGGGPRGRGPPPAPPASPTTTRAPSTRPPLRFPIRRWPPARAACWRGRGRLRRYEVPNDDSPCCCEPPPDSRRRRGRV